MFAESELPNAELVHVSLASTFLLYLYVISSKTSFIFLALFCGGTGKLIMATRTCQHFYGISLYSNQASPGPGHSWRCGLYLVAKQTNDFAAVKR